MVIVVILLPLAAVFIGSIQSEKSLQADTRRLLPPEVTLDNFLVILSKGEQRGRIFEQATYLPDNIKRFYRAFANSLIVASSVTVLPCCSARCRPTPSPACATDGRCSCCRPTSSRASCRRSC